MKNGYDPFIDYLKGYCILAVILQHCLRELRDDVMFAYWGTLAVPIFLILQSFHVFRKDRIGVQRRQLANMCQRICIPFIVVTLIGFFLQLIFRDISFIDLAKTTIRAGGISFDSGSYYFWVYIQFFFLIPLIYWIFRRFNVNLVVGGVIFILVSLLIELYFSCGHMPYWLYRLCCLRYIFLIYLGLIWSRNGIVLNVTTFSLSVLSIIFLTIFVYTDINTEPFFYQKGWKECHWICYFYPAFLFIHILKWIYGRLPSSIKSLLEEIGKYSWEIFLMQMFFFAMFPKQRLLMMGNYWLMLSLYSILAFTFSIAPIIFMRRHYNINSIQ